MADIKAGDEVQAITWTPSENAAGPIGYDGRVGKIALFSYTWVGGGEKPYMLHTPLPGYQSRRWRVASPEAAQALAERVLAKWLGLIGATLASEPPEVARTFTDNSQEG